MVCVTSCIETGLKTDTIMNHAIELEPNNNLKWMNVCVYQLSWFKRKHSFFFPNIHITHTFIAHVFESFVSVPNLMLSSVRKPVCYFIFFFRGCQLSTKAPQNEKNQIWYIWQVRKWRNDRNEWLILIYLCGSKRLYRFVLNTQFLQQVHPNRMYTNTSRTGWGNGNRPNYGLCIRIWFLTLINTYK